MIKAPRGYLAFDKNLKNYIICLDLSHSEINMKITSATAIGGRSYQEDRIVNAGNENGRLIAIMDGHGGDETAEFVSKNLWDVFSSFGPDSEGRTALSSTIQKLNELTGSNESGSTLSAVWIPRGELYANISILGDSPVIVKNPRERRWLSPKHNVRTNLADRKYSVERGGSYSERGYICVEAGPGSNGEIMYLQLSRTLGDSSFGKILNREPEIFSLHLRTGAMIILGSDGVLDPSHEDSSSDVGRLIQMVKNGAEAQALVNDALRRETSDNATAIVAVL